MLWVLEIVKIVPVNCGIFHYKFVVFLQYQLLPGHLAVKIVWQRSAR